MIPSKTRSPIPASYVPNVHDACDERNYDEAYLTWKDSRCENRYARQKYFDRVIKSPGLENKRFNE